MNQSAALNAINLISTCLLATEQHVLTRPALVLQLDLYLQLQQAAPYHSAVTLPEGNGEALLIHAVKLNKVQLQQDGFGDLVRLSEENAVIMSYYRNNISHLFIIPALIATALLQHRSLTQVQLLNICQQLSPLLEHELFLAADLNQYVDNILQFLMAQQLVEFNQHYYSCTTAPERLAQLKLLAHNSNDILQRYAIVLNLLQQQQRIERGALEQGCQQLAQRLLTMHGIDAPEYHDKQLFATLIHALKDADYIVEAADGQLQQNHNFAPLLTSVNALVLAEVLQTIRQITAGH